MYDRRSIRPQDQLNGSVAARVKVVQDELELSCASPPALSDLSSDTFPFLATVGEIASFHKEDNFQAALFIFAFSQELLPQIPLQLRAQPRTLLYPRLESFLRKEFLPMVFKQLSETNRVSKDVFDLDTNIFGRMLHELMLVDGRLEELFDSAARKDFNSRWSAFASVPSLPAFCASFDVQTQPPPIASSDKVTVLPFTNDIFETDLSSIHVDTAESPTSALPVPKFGTVFNDVKHWHSTKQLDDKKKAPETPWQQKRRLKSHQRFMANLQRSAQSLTGALGTPLKRQTIPLASSVKAVRAVTVHPGQQQKNAKVKMSKADVIKAEHAAKKSVFFLARLKPNLMPCTEKCNSRRIRKRGGLVKLR